MSRMLHDKTFYRTFAILTLSLALQNLLTYSVNLADNIMLGDFHRTRCRAHRCATSCNSFCRCWYRASVRALSCWAHGTGGKKDLKPIPDIIGAGLRFGVSIAAVLFVLALLFPPRSFA